VAFLSANDRHIKFLHPPLPPTKLKRPSIKILSTLRRWTCRSCAFLVSPAYQNPGNASKHTAGKRQYYSSHEKKKTQTETTRVTLESKFLQIERYAHFCICQPAILVAQSKCGAVSYCFFHFVFVI
jgi:hypothetical protein